MKSVEVTGNSLKEATANAAAELGVGIDALNVTVLEETKGLFGKTVFRVRAEVVEEPEPIIDPVVEEPAPVEPEPEPEPAPEPESVPEPAPAAEEAQPAAPATEETAEVEEESAEAEQVVASQEDAEQFAGLLRGLLDDADLEVKVTCGSVNGRYVNLDIDGKDVAFLVGKHGEVINALQYLVNIIGSRKFTKGVRATVDGNNYRQRREETLRNLSLKIAEQVKKRGEEAVLDALPAFERRIVHKALDGIEGVVTYSEGEEPNRRVVIAPGE